MGVRRRGREYALQMLYAMDLTGYQPDQVFAGFYAIQDLNRDAFYYARRLVDGVHGQLEEIDAVLTKYAEQMDKVREQSKLASAKLDEMTAAAESSWHKMVADMEKLRNAFTSSFHYFKSQV